MGYDWQTILNGLRNPDPLTPGIDPAQEQSFSSKIQGLDPEFLKQFTGGADSYAKPQMMTPAPTPQDNTPVVQPQTSQPQNIVSQKIRQTKPAAAPVKPVTPEQPTDSSDTINFGQNNLSTVDMLKKAIAERENKQDTSDMMHYAAMLSEHQMRGQANLNQDLRDMAKEKAAGANEPIKDQMMLQDQQKNDPNSALSLGMKDMVEKVTGKKIAGGASGSDLEKTFPWLQKAYENEETRNARHDDLKWKYQYLKDQKEATAKTKDSADLEKMSEKMGNDLDTNKRQTGPMGKSQQVVNDTQSLVGLAHNYQNLDKVPEVQYAEMVSALDRLVSRGNPTVERFKHLMPPDAALSGAGIIRWLSSEPTGANQGAFIKSILNTAKIEGDIAKDQVRDAQFKKAYGTWKKVKEKDPELFYSKLSTYTDLDPEEIKQIEKTQGFTGGYKKLQSKSSEAPPAGMSANPNEERRQTADRRTAIFDKKTKQFLRYE